MYRVPTGEEAPRPERGEGGQERWAPAPRPSVRAAAAALPPGAPGWPRPREQPSPGAALHKSTFVYSIIRVCQ